MKVLKFLLMVSLGLALVVLLADERQDRNNVDVDSVSGDSGGGAMKLDGEGDKDITVTFGTTTVSVKQPMPGPDGSTIEREVRRVTFIEGRPGEDGNFQAKEPFVEILDLEENGDDGLPRVNATIVASRASFMMGDSVGGDVKIDLATVSPDRYSLIGDVHGEFFDELRNTTIFDTHRVDVDGPLLIAPGAFSISNIDMTLSGIGLHWDQDTGELHIDGDARFEAPPTALTLGWELFAPGGLHGVLDPQADDVRTTAVFDMVGPVTGETSDGGRFGGDMLHFDGPDNTITFVDRASFERTGVDEHVRLDAERIVATLPPAASEVAENVPSIGNDLGLPAIDRLHADGNVTIVSLTSEELPSWLWAPSVTVENGVLRSPDIVRWEVNGILTEGSDLTHHLNDGDMRLAGPTTLTVESGTLEGLTAFAPGGMTWNVPPVRDETSAREVTGEMVGRVTGSMADGSTFAGEMLYVDGTRRVLTLDDDVVVEKNTQRIDADRLVVQQNEGDPEDEDDDFTTATALGDVLVVSTPAPNAPEGTPTTRVVTNEFTLAGDVATAPGIVTVEHGALTVTGLDLTWNDTTGRLQFAHDAHLIDLTPRVDADGNEIPAQTNLIANGGIDWTLPPDAVSAFDEGHGRLFGPVAGSTSDGVVIDAGLVEFDGPARSITLRHDARLETRTAENDPIIVTSNHIVATRIDDGAPGTIPLYRIESDENIVIDRPRMTIRGFTVHFDEIARVLTIAQDPEIVSRDSSGNVDFRLRGRGSLTWTLPTDPEQPFMEGHGRIEGPEISGNTKDGLTFGGKALVMGPGLRELSLLGPGWVQQVKGIRNDRVDASTTIDLVRNSDGEIITINAKGSVVAKLVDGVATTDASGESLLIDRANRRNVLTGSPRIARRGPDSTHVVTAERDITTIANFFDEVQTIDANVGVTMTTGDTHVTCSDMSWDIPGDVAILRGPCLVTMFGSQLTGAEIMLRPESQEFEIRDSGITLDENR